MPKVGGGQSLSPAGNKVPVCCACAGGQTTGVKLKDGRSPSQGVKGRWAEPEVGEVEASGQDRWSLRWMRHAVFELGSNISSEDLCYTGGSLKYGLVSTGTR